MRNKSIYILLIGLIAYCQSGFSQTAGGEMIRGKVISNKQEELISATVLEIDKSDRVQNHTLTDINGEFAMKITDPKNRLKVSYLGFMPRTVPIGDSKNITIVLSEDNVLSEVVITRKKSATDGTMSIPAREVTFAMQTISADEFEGVQVSSIDDALQGQIAGLDIVGSGDLGKGTSMRIRGTSSINANVEPLIVMNGVPREDISSTNFDFATASEEQFADLLNINPDDILTITALKDAASTAVYGSKGANGVLLITTRKGAKGPTRVNYTYKFSGSIQPPGMKMLNGDDYTMLMKQAYFNKEQSNASSNIREFNYDPTFSEYWNYNQNTDWRKEVIQTGQIHDHYLVISGGGEKANFRVAGGYMSQKGTIIGQGWDRLTSRIDLDYYVSERIKFASEFAFSYTDNDRSWSDGRGDNSYNNGRSILDIAYRKMPNLGVYERNAQGDLTGNYYTIHKDAGIHTSQKTLRNPVAQARLATNNVKSYNIQPILRLRYDFLDPNMEGQTLQYQVYVSFQFRNDNTYKFLPQELSYLEWDHADINRKDKYDFESFQIQSSNSINWIPKFSSEDHYLNMYAAVETTSANSNSQSEVSYGSPSSNGSGKEAEGTLESLGSSLGQKRSIGMIGRLHYSYLSRYVASFTFRRDGSTKFGINNKFGNFPAVSLRWNIIDEPFMASVKDKWLDMLAIRPGWGITGNEPTSEYLHFSKYESYSSYAGATTFRPANIRLADLKWEKLTEYNVGLDIATKENKYELLFNVYTRRTSDMLFTNKTIPTSTGYSKIANRNGGTMDNTGWDLAFNGNNFLKVGNVKFDFRFNLANSVNKIVSLDQDILDEKNKPFTYENGKYLARIQQGNSYGSIYGFRYLGVYEYSAENYEKGTAPVARNSKGDVIMDSDGNPLPMYFNYGLNGRNYKFQAGDAIYEDINNDGTIDELDIVYLGNSLPKLTGGFGLTLRWQRFSCLMFMNFRYGNKIVNAARMNAENMYHDNNQSIAVNWRWRKEGDQTEIPRALHEYGYNWLGSDRFVEDGSFFRMKYVTLHYDLPTNLIKPYGIRQVKFYMTVNNLFCLTKYTGVDPEVGYGGMGVSTDNSTTPRARDFTMGITLGF